MIKVTTPNTIFGDITRKFDSYSDALKWVEICLENDLKVIVEKI
jgi:hypothetical protein